MISDTIRAKYMNPGKHFRAEYANDPSACRSDRLPSDLHGAFCSPTTFATDMSGNITSETASIESGYNVAIGDARMSFAYFVESKFIPEHVDHKTGPGRTFYHSIIKHILRPESVDNMIGVVKTTKSRLKSIPNWPYLDDVRMCELTPDHVRRLISAALADGYSTQTVKHIRNVISAIIRHAEREKCFSGINPVKGFALPTVKPRVERHLTISQTKAILELMVYPEKELALLALTTGMKIADICKLQWKDVNLSDSASYIEGESIPPRSIAVRAQWNCAGVGDVKRGRTKNIPIPEPLFSVLKQLDASRSNSDRHQFLLLSKKGKPVVPASIRLIRLKPIGEKLGLPWLSWQVIRRAHTELLFEFRGRLNQQMATLGNGGRIEMGDIERSNEVLVAGAKRMPVPKFFCRTFPSGLSLYRGARVKDDTGG